MEAVEVVEAVEPVEPVEPVEAVEPLDEAEELPAAEVADGDVDTPERQPTRLRDPLRRWKLATAACAVAVLGLLVGLIISLTSSGSDNSLENARASALTAAQTYSVEIAGYDYRHLNQDFGVVLSHSTPAFKQSFVKSSDALRATLVKYHATATAKVVAAGVVSATTSKVVVLVFLDQVVTNTNQKAPTTDRSQVEMTLTASGGSWLIDGVVLL